MNRRNNVVIGNFNTKTMSLNLPTVFLSKDLLERRLQESEKQYQLEVPTHNETRLKCIADDSLIDNFYVIRFVDDNGITYEVGRRDRLASSKEIFTVEPIVVVRDMQTIRQIDRCRNIEELSPYFYNVWQGKKIPENTEFTFKKPKEENKFFYVKS